MICFFIISLLATYLPTCLSSDSISGGPGLEYPSFEIALHNYIKSSTAAYKATATAINGFMYNSQFLTGNFTENGYYLDAIKIYIQNSKSIQQVSNTFAAAIRKMGFHRIDNQDTLDFPTGIWSGIILGLQKIAGHQESICGQMENLANLLETPSGSTLVSSGGNLNFSTTIVFETVTVFNDTSLLVTKIVTEFKQIAVLNNYWLKDIFINLSANGELFIKLFTRLSLKTAELYASWSAVTELFANSIVTTAAKTGGTIAAASFNAILMNLNLNLYHVYWDLTNGYEQTKNMLLGLIRA